MEPTALEIEASRVAYLIGETKGRKFSKQEWDSVHPDIYGKCTQELADKLTATLCSFLKKHNSLGYSLEMQIWWRDHQHKDKQREKAEKQKRQAEKDKQKALAKLTAKEKRLLGLL
jgi:hypothetical protein